MINELKYVKFGEIVIVDIPKKYEKKYKLITGTEADIIQNAKELVILRLKDRTISIDREISDKILVRRMK